MILNSAPQDQAILSNVGQIGEFRIRNSAKAFSILSSGLYANKVRAIIRELSCNAVDSHTAAGKSNTPFDIHLPNSLEPWFSIRDYGTGLSHEQVTNIYTTYFESTKTASNEFIGALGLGSKSPFSYTDNFTVTAVQNGIKGVYTAFINESGVPSIAQMMTEETSDPSGVEVKFSVNDRYDFDKFRSEARDVYKYFKLKPVVSGNGDFGFKEVEYETENIILGVHSTSDSRASVAIMGNIAYPIAVPEADKSLGNLRELLGCGLVMEFGIGELDFQASREGLSYIPQTIDSIKRKLETVTAQLAIHIATEADAITNTWEKAIFLNKKFDSHLWKNAVTKYVADTNFKYAGTTNSWNRVHIFQLDEAELKEKYNVLLRGFSKSRGYNACSNIKAKNHYEPDASGINVMKQQHCISIGNEVRFVINDTKVGCTERAKYHVKNSKMVDGKDGLHRVNMFVIEAFDKTKKVDVAGFKTLLANPPEAFFMQASSLLEKERAESTMGKNVTILHLTEKNYGSWGRNTKTVWNDAGKADSFDKKATHYYIPLSGFQALGKVSDVKLLKQHLDRSSVYSGTIYGVRKSDIEFIKTQKNWINIDEMILEKLAKLDVNNVMGMVKHAIDFKEVYKYNASTKVTNQDSPYVKLSKTFQDVESVDRNKQQSLEFLARAFDVNSNVSPAALIEKYTQEMEAVQNRYPMLKHATGYTVKIDELADYINIVDTTKGVK